MLSEFHLVPKARSHINPNWATLVSGIAAGAGKGILMRGIAAVFACLVASTAVPGGAIVNGQLDGNLHPQVGTLVADIPPYAYGIP